ncbi:T-complex protein 1 subunit zeta [Nematocida sp. LUAm3]|nr:T-complex protein 1 subunit zeta [Nematocida sp. LUAm3]KAI5174834.1 T-complex protein 1 subunit zeta [Nematocida sp. LUAm2]KAI5177568.1 T-complex protein 1 subunit zeta [Nematocida sp. LUAm1]
MYLGKETEITQVGQGIFINIEAIKNLAEMVRNGLGPNSAQKLLITPAGEIRLVKDGLTLLRNIQLAQPAAVLLSKIVVQQGVDYGDGVTSSLLMASSLLNKSLEYLKEGVHPQVLISGLIKREKEILKELEKIKIEIKNPKEVFSSLLLSSLRTKFSENQSKEFSRILSSAIERVTENGSSDVQMIEILKMLNIDSVSPIRLVDGLVLDHGGRHPHMPKKITNVYILSTNLSFEYEKPEINSQFYYKSTAEKIEMEKEERRNILERVQKIISTMREIAEEAKDSQPNFMVITQKGIDAYALEVFAKYNVLALRRAKKRNMERLEKITGSSHVTSLKELTKDSFGYAGLVREISVGEDKFTFIENTPFNKACTLLIQGISSYQMEYLEAAVKSTIKSLSKVTEEKAVLPGGGSSFLKIALEMEEGESLEEKASFAIWKEALLSVPRALYRNSGNNSIDILSKTSSSSHSFPTIDLATAEVVDAVESSILDNYSSIQNIISSSTIAATKILMIDEIIKSGKEIKQ